MNYYMTNVFPYDGIAENVRIASEQSGVKVEYRNHPCPVDHTDPDLEFYIPDSSMGSIFSFEFGKDHSEFWKVLHKLEGKPW